MSNMHGRWKLEMFKHNIILAQGKDGWNAKAAEVYSEELKILAAPLRDKPWVILGDARLWGLAVNDCIPIMVELANWLLDNNCKGEVYITNNGMQEQEVMAFSDIKPEGYLFTCTRSIEEASSILDEFGFNISPESVNNAFA